MDTAQGTLITGRSNRQMGLRCCEHQSFAECPRPFGLLVVVNVDNHILPPMGWNMTFKQNINLAVGSVLHLGEPDPGHDCTNKRSAGPDVAALAT
jgi:hypothetical protein